MKYVFDESAIYYMLETFPRKAVPVLFERFCADCNNGDIVSDKETRKSLNHLFEEEDSFEWLDGNKKMFYAIDQRESELLGDLILAGRFEFLSDAAEFSRNLPIAIPFIITIAKSQNRTLVMDKKAKDSKALENICQEEDVCFFFVDDYLKEAAERGQE